MKACRSKPGIILPKQAEKIDVFSRDIPEEFHSYRVSRGTFTIYVGGEPHQEKAANELDLGEQGVEYRMADRFEMNLDMLSGIDENRPILVKVATCGGFWEE